MSQVTTYSNLEELESVRYSAASTTYPPSNVMFDAIAAMSAATINDLITGSVDMKSSSFNAHSKQMDLKSPNAMRFAFKEAYAKNMNFFQTANVAELTKQKSAVVKTISEMAYRIENKTAVCEKIVQVLSADKQIFKQSVESVMNEIQMQHGQVFTKEMVEIVSKASSEAGFKTLNVVIKNSIPVISAVDERGRGIVSEIRTDGKTQVVDLISEAIGMADGSCADAMQKFGDALNKYGVKYSDANRKWTGGNCWLPNAKEVEQAINGNNGKKQLEKTRKLNTNTKLKVN
jgi:hypothetical protein